MKPKLFLAALAGSAGVVSVGGCASGGSAGSVFGAANTFAGSSVGDSAGAAS